jgi:hypothetical protein
MTPMVTLLLLCLSALVLIACGVAVLWSLAAKPTEHPTGGRQRGATFGYRSWPMQGPR